MVEQLTISVSKEASNVVETLRLRHENVSALISSLLVEWSKSTKVADPMPTSAVRVETEQDIDTIINKRIELDPTITPQSAQRVKEYYLKNLKEHPFNVDVATGHILKE